jgi:hypothetical protein
MKKLLTVILICLCVLPLFAQRTRSGIQDRIVEFGIVDVEAGFANNFLAGEQLSQETLVIDLDELVNGFSLNFGASVSPLYFNYNNRKGWGFGLFSGLEAAGFFDLSGNMLSLGETTTDNERSSIGGAVVIEAGAHAYFTLNKLKVKVKPSLYLPLLYIEPEHSYMSYTNSDNGFGLNYDMRMYSALDLPDLEPGSSLEDFLQFDHDNVMSQVTASPGFDLSVGVEYPLTRALGLSGFWRIFDFDIGADAYHIPVIPAVMNDYLQLVGGIGDGGTLNITDLENLVGSEFNPGNEEIFVRRPFKLLAWLNWRPIFGSYLLSIKPSFGFSINPIYTEPFSMEGGLDVTLDLFNFFVVTAGASYEDRLWRKSLDLAINLRIMELDVGIDIRSQDFTDCWNVEGLGARVSLKFGW